MSNGDDIIKIVIVIIGVFSIVGLIVGLIGLGDIGLPDNPQNMTEKEVGKNVENILWIAIVIIFGCIILSAIVGVLKCL